MNLSGAAFAVIFTAVFGAGTLTVAILNAIVGKGGRRADVAAKLVEASGQLVERFEKELDELDDVKLQCRKCETRLSETEERLRISEIRQLEAEKRERTHAAAIRALVWAMDSNDPDATAVAVAAARRLV